MADSAEIGRFGGQVSVGTFRDKKTGPRFWYLYCIALGIAMNFEYFKKICPKCQVPNTFQLKF